MLNNVFKSLRLLRMQNSTNNRRGFVKISPKYIYLLEIDYLCPVCIHKGHILMPFYIKNICLMDWKITIMWIIPIGSRLKST